MLARTCEVQIRLWHRVELSLQDQTISFCEVWATYRGTLLRKLWRCRITPFYSLAYLVHKMKSSTTANEVVVMKQCWGESTKIFVNNLFQPSRG